MRSMKMLRLKTYVGDPFMHVHSVSSSKERKAADVIVLPFWSDKKKALPACECKEFDALIKFPIEEGDFLG